jgi:hypothetical protein
LTTVIAPSTGAGVLYTQQGVGTAPGYSALDDRRKSYGPLQEGVLGPSDFAVAQRGAGANMSVDIGMPAGGVAYVQGDTISGQGLYTVPVHAATINEVIAGADPTNPRVDQIILEVQDNVLDASAGNLARTRVLTGTPTATASLTNRLGAQSLPGTALRLADVLVPAGSTSVTTGNINDRRSYARFLFTSSTPGGSATVAGGQFLLAQPGATVTLPPASLNAYCLVVAATGVATGSPATVAYGSGGGGIFGLGLSNAASFNLGTSFAWALLHCYDGVNWAVLGQQDTGWVALTLGTGVSAIAGGYVPSARLQGDTVELRGGLQCTAPGSGLTWATIPTGLRPAATVQNVTGWDTIGATTTYTISTGGLLTISQSSGSLSQLYLASITYPLTA